MSTLKLSWINRLFIDKISSYLLTDGARNVLSSISLLAVFEAVQTHHHMWTRLIYYCCLTFKANFALLRALRSALLFFLCLLLFDRIINRCFWGRAIPVKTAWVILIELVTIPAEVWLHHYLAVWAKVDHSNWFIYLLKIERILAFFAVYYAIKIATLIAFPSRTHRLFQVVVIQAATAIRTPAIFKDFLALKTFIRFTKAESVSF
jgi:hypothetical protein